jgi:hypothetical protein
MNTRQTKIRKSYIAIAVAAVAVAGIATAVVVNRPVESQKNTTTPVVTKTVTQADVVSYTGEKDKTALVQLKAVASGVVTKSSSYGEYVDAIGSLKGGQDGKYWSFYIDGKMASVGGDAYVSKGGEKIEWKFEKAQ